QRFQGAAPLDDPDGAVCYEENRALPLFRSTVDSPRTMADPLDYRDPVQRFGGSTVKRFDNSRTHYLTTNPQTITALLWSVDCGRSTGSVHGARLSRRVIEIRTGAARRRPRRKKGL